MIGLEKYFIENNILMNFPEKYLKTACTGKRILV